MGAAAASLLALLAAPLHRTVNAQASDGQAVLLGAENVSEAGTRVRRVASGEALAGDAIASGVGVAGRSPQGIGIYGLSDEGHGILAVSDRGSALEAQSVRGVALRVRRGRIVADDVSGVARIAQGEQSTLVRAGMKLDSASFVLLSPMGALEGRDLWYRPDDEGLFHIELSEPLTKDLFVGWLMIG